jgi:hypothetical protein
MSIQSTVGEALLSGPLVMKTAAELITHPQLEIVALHEADATRIPTNISIKDVSAATAAAPEDLDFGPLRSLMIDCRIAGSPPRTIECRKEAVLDRGGSVKESSTFPWLFVSPASVLNEL